MLDSLQIKNFRSLKDFQVSRLGHVNLIVGKNNSGKSSVLEALRIFAGNAQRNLLEQIAAEHNEKYRLHDTESIENGDYLPFEDLFTGRKFPNSDDDAISIGSISGTETLRIEHGLVAEIEETVTNDLGGTIETSTRIRRQRVFKEALNQDESHDSIRQALFITKGERSTLMLLDALGPRFRPNILDTAGTLPCSSIPTQFVSVDELADIWDKIVFTEHEEFVKKSLQIISSDFENITFVRNEEYPSPSRRPFRRSAIIKLQNISRPVPLNSLGDGMLRICQLAIKVFSAKDGILLIDEFENGLHYTVMKKVWQLLFEIAKKLNIQIFATTHSWDCIESFANAAVENKDVEGILFRIGKSVRISDKGEVISTIFDQDALRNVTQADMEVR